MLRNYFVMENISKALDKLSDIRTLAADTEKEFSKKENLKPSNGVDKNVTYDRLWQCVNALSEVTTHIHLAQMDLMQQIGAYHPLEEQKPVCQ